MDGGGGVDRQIVDVHILQIDDTAERAMVQKFRYMIDGFRSEKDTVD
jgi:hypothetical protein